MPASPIPGLDQLAACVGRQVAVSDWVEVTQERINRFAEATEDRQWIHLDAERARAESAYGATIAHGFLTLSLLSALAAAVRVPGIRMAVNYGLNRVRFPAPVPAGSLIRGRFTLVAFEGDSGGAKVTWSVVVERQGGDKPCCVAEWIVLYCT